MWACWTVAWFSMTRRLALAALRAGLAALTGGGCYAYRQVPTTPVPTSQVRVVLRTARTLSTVPLPPDTVRRTYGGILEAGGVIQAAAGDSLSLRLGELRSATGPVEAVDGQVVMIATADIERLEERRFQAGGTALAGLGAAAVAMTVFFVVTIAAIIRSF